MDAGRKRKAPPATPSSNDGSATKKLRLLNSKPAPKAAPGVRDVGYKLLEHLRNAKDKNGRSIVTQFLTLPPREDLPDYYDFTKLPIAIDTIERKLEQNAYPTITTLESDLKRMVQNAKDYNTTGSDIFEDAERIRKLVYNYMKVNNPAYIADPSYQSFPTPLPQPGEQTANIAPQATAVNGQRERRDRSSSIKRAPTTPAPDRKSSIAPSATTGDDISDGDYTGKTFQEAQQMLIAEMLQHKDEEGLEVFLPFGNLPSRKLEDYYKVIRNPVSLKGVAKRVRGQHGRNAPTGVTDFKNWDAFEEEVSWIWKNARDYNEDGSDMYELSLEFEKVFKDRLAEAKSKVEEPAGPKLRLGGPKPKVTLNLSQQRRPSPSPAGVTVDNEALARQKQMVAAGVNGKQTEPRPSPAVNGTPKPISQAPAVQPPRPQSSSAQSPPESVKMEKTATQSPAVSAAIPVTAATNGMMAPPLVRPHSASPFPNGQPPVSSYHYTAPALLPPTPTRPYPVADALLPQLIIATHPTLRLTNPVTMNIAPHPTLSHQSRTVTLPSSHYWLQITPTISRTLSMGRPYKMFVIVNGTRLPQRDTISHQDSGRRTHVYEGTLMPGVNRVEVEVAAAKEGEAKGLDVEKVTVFANMVKQ